MNRSERPETSPRVLRDRLLTGPDDRTFCARASQALEEGYALYGSPSISISGEKVVVAQAVIWPAEGKNGEEGGEPRVTDGALRIALPSQPASARARGCCAVLRFRGHEARVCGRGHVRSCVR